MDHRTLDELVEAILAAPVVDGRLRPGDVQAFDAAIAAAAGSTAADVWLAVNKRGSVEHCLAVHRSIDMRPIFLAQHKRYSHHPEWCRCGLRFSWVATEGKLSPAEHLKGMCCIVAHDDGHVFVKSLDRAPNALVCSLCKAEACDVPGIGRVFFDKELIGKTCWVRATPPAQPWRSARPGDRVWRRYSHPMYDRVYAVSFTGGRHPKQVLLERAGRDYEGNVWPI